MVTEKIISSSPKTQCRVETGRQSAGANKTPKNWHPVSSKKKKKNSQSDFLDYRADDSRTSIFNLFSEKTFSNVSTGVISSVGFNVL